MNSFITHKKLLSKNITLVSIRFLFRIYFVIILFLMIIGCEITALEPITQTSINTPNFVEAEIGDFHTGAHVAGNIRLSVPQNQLTFDVGRINYFIDSLRLFFGEDSNFPYSLTLDTRNYSQREHILTVAVYEQKPTLGIYNLLEMPRLVYSTSAVFDQTPPSKVDSLTISYDGNILIQWSQTSTPSFGNYQVSTSFFSDYLLNSDDYSTTISERTTTSWRINSSSYPVGTSVYVNITINNGAEVAPYNQSTGVVGKSIPIQAPIISFWRHPSLNQTYACATDGRIYVLSDEGSTVIRSSTPLGSGVALFKEDGTNMYIFNSASKSLKEYSLTNFSLVRTIQLPDYISEYATCVFSSNGKFYIGNSEGKIWTYNESTSELVSSTRFFEYSSWNPSMTTTEDGRYLFLSDDGSIYKLNIQTDTPSVVKKITPFLGNGVPLMNISQDQQNLFVLSSGSFHIVQISDMSIVSTISLTNPPCNSRNYNLQTYAMNFFQDGTSLFITSHSRFIEQFDLTTNRSIKSWCIINYPQSITVSRDGKYLLVGALGTPIPNLLLAR